MPKIKTSELAGAALDWAVAKCEVAEPVGSFLDGVVPHPDYNNFHPSTDWAQGGPIIEREAHNLFKHNGGTQWCCACNVPRAEYTAIVTADGPTPLIAAMRCYCCSKLGDVIDIPEELCQ